jgi:hypothetical protein
MGDGPEPQTILVGIDGTGDVLDSAYKPNFENSFVSQIIRTTNAKHKLYVRGPGFDGADMFGYANQALEFIHLTNSTEPNTRILLTGYSRGGAGVIDVARQLKKQGLMVDAMVLFDPVDRSGTSDGYDVPNNVLYMVQALRATMSLSRVSFNNCAASWHAPTKCTRKHFWATHGGLGGCPWPVKPGVAPSMYIDEDESFKERALSFVVYDVMHLEWKRPDDYRGSLDQLRDARYFMGGTTQVTYEQDRAGAQQVWDWVYPKLIELGFLAKAAAAA